MTDTILGPCPGCGTTFKDECSTQTWITNPAGIHEGPPKLEHAPHACIAVLKGAVKTLAGVLQEAEHSLITLHGLWATDKPNEYEDALREGADANGARDLQNDVTWRIDEQPVIQHIKSALTSIREGSGLMNPRPYDPMQYDRLVEAFEDAMAERDSLRKQCDTALARAEKAEMWIKTHEKYLGKMQHKLCVHGSLGVSVSKVQEWFGAIEWFNVTTPDPATASEKDRCPGCACPWDEHSIPDTTPPGMIIYRCGGCGTCPEEPPTASEESTEGMES